MIEKMRRVRRESEERGDLCEAFLLGHGLVVGLLEWRKWFMAVAQVVVVVVIGGT